MAKQLNVLYGFTSDKIQQSIAKEITLRGFVPKGVKMTTKGLIAEYIKKHPEVNVVILKEYLDGGGVYSPIELTELVDEVRNLNVVIVLATNHRGKNEMKELYAAGILNAFFSDGKFGANPDKLAELATKGRTRKEARQYYRIDEIVPDHINITYEEFNDYYRYLVDDRQGMNIINRFVQISRMLYPGQMGAFIDRLPDKVKQILMKYKEFYDIANKVYKLGYAKEKYKVPKDAVEGITKEAIRDEMVRAAKAGKTSAEPELVSVQSTSSPVKEVKYDEPLGLDRVLEKEMVEPSAKDEVSEEAPPEKPKKKGLFGGRKEKKAKAKDEQRESIFEQESDVDFGLEGIDSEPIADTDDWGGTPQFDTRAYSQPQDVGAQVQTPVQTQASQRQVLNVQVGSVEAHQWPQVEIQQTPSAPVQQTALPPVQQTNDGNIDLDSMSVEDLKKLLGN